MTRALDLGLPTNDLRGFSLVFNVPTSTLGVGIWVERADVCLGEVFIRARGAGAYRRVAVSEEPNISDESLITCSGPYLFFIRKLGRKSESGWGFNFRGIVRLDLRSGQHEVCVTPGMKAGHQWAAALHSATSDGRIVYASVASLPPGASEVRYTVSKVDLSNETVTELIDLPAMFV